MPIACASYENVCCSFACLIQGDVTSVNQLLLAGEDPNCCDLTGSTAMVAAATNQHPEVVKRLFKAGGDVNMTDRNVRHAE